MKFKIEKKLRILPAAIIVLILSASMTGLAGCASQESKVEPQVILQTDIQNVNAESRESDDSPSTVSTLNNAESQNNYENGQNNNKNSLAEYISLLGKSKDELPGILNETPDSAGEGGLEFKKAGIRVWFDAKENKMVDQIFTTRKDIDLNGVKIGDKIDTFKKVFGEPVSDKNGDMHFKYQGIFLSVIHDTKTGETFALYILKKDF